MKYIKAQAVLPKSLLAEIQKFVQGELIYIPKSQTNYIKWGTNTGTKELLAIRNENIIQAFKSGASIVKLSEIYNLSEETIKKIVYRKHQ